MGPIHRGLDHEKESWFFCVKFKHLPIGGLEKARLRQQTVLYWEIFNYTNYKTKTKRRNKDKDEYKDRRIPMWNRKGPIEATDTECCFETSGPTVGPGTAVGHSPHPPGPAQPYSTNTNKIHIQIHIHIHIQIQIQIQLKIQIHQHKAKWLLEMSWS